MGPKNLSVQYWGKGDKSRRIRFEAQRETTQWTLFCVGARNWRQGVWETEHSDSSSRFSSRDSSAVPGPGASQ